MPAPLTFGPSVVNPVRLRDETSRGSMNIDGLGASSHKFRLLIMCSELHFGMIRKCLFTAGNLLLFKGLRAVFPMARDVHLRKCLQARGNRGAI